MSGNDGGPAAPSFPSERAGATVPDGRASTLAARVLNRHPRSVFVLLSAAIGVFGWQVPTVPGISSLDLSWEIGLHQAATSGLRFGHDIVWTYGPLGFLAFPTPFVGPTSALAFAAVAALVLATVAILLRASRRLFPLWAAALVTLVTARALEWIAPVETLQFVALAIGVEALRRAEAIGPYRAPAVAGVLAAVAVMAKLNVGVFVAAGAGAVILSVASPRLRALFVYATAFVVAWVGLWLITAQQLSDLVPYVRASIDVISGYSEAMSSDQPNMVLAILAFGAITALVLVAAFLMSRGWPRDRRLAMAAVMALLTFALWKNGFVRSHLPATFVTLAFTLLVVMPRSMPRWAMASAFGVALAAFFSVTQASPLRFVDVRRSPAEFAHQALDALSLWRWGEATAVTREHLQASFDIPGDLLDDLAGRTVHIDPYQAAVATAYPGFTWRPLPIFQSYEAYTLGLDEVNASLLRSPDRPERILRNYQPRSAARETIPYALDGRNYWFESPAATLERLCRYREIAASEQWQVLADTGHGCGAVAPISQVTVRLGDTVSVPSAPSPDSFVLVRVLGLDPGLLGRLRAIAWRAPEQFMIVDTVKYRLVPGTASAGLLLAVPAVAQGSSPFAFGDPRQTISVQSPTWDQDGKVTFEFVAVSASEQ